MEIQRRQRPVTEVKHRLLGYINGELLAERALVAGPETPLFADGWIDSLSILKLIAYLELITGREIPDEEIVMKNFQTVNTIAERFATKGL
jgi:acyl carrier protein